jgi:2-iminobutanoate/2-iminopropanoate deaminase
MKVIHTNEAPRAIGPYSQGIIAGNFFYSSGQIPLKLDGSFEEGPIEDQTKQVFENLIAILRAADLTLQDVVKTTVFLHDMNEFSRMNEIYEQYFGDHKPARSTIQVARLPKDVKVEIEIVGCYFDTK